MKAVFYFLSMNVYHNWHWTMNLTSKLIQFRSENPIPNLDQNNCLKIFDLFMGNFRAPYIHADILSDVRSNPGLALVCFSAEYLSTLKELTFYPEKGVPTLGTPERGKTSGIFFSLP